METESRLDSFDKMLASANTTEEKLNIAIRYMGELLASAEKTNPLQEFWKVKNQCIALFKEKMHPYKRSVLWKEYRALSKEAIRLKTLLEKESMFQADQIELAILALKTDVESADEHTLESLAFPDKLPRFLQTKDQYSLWQGQFLFYQGLGLRLEALKKELLQVNLPIKKKRPMFKELSRLGNCIFPKRRDVVRLMSTTYLSDVTHFAEMVKREGQEMKRPPFELRQEVKAFQQLSKLITIEGSAFSKSRQYLNQVWDIANEVAIERKRTYEAKREIFSENYKKIQEEIELFAKRAPVLTASGINKGCDDLLEKIESYDLPRKEKNACASALEKVRSEQIEVKKAAAVEVAKVQEEKVGAFKEQLILATQKSARLAHATLIKKRDSLRNMQDEVGLAGDDSVEVTLLFLQLEHLILTKDKADSVLEKWEQHQSALKEVCNRLRKEEGKGGSGFDVALMLQEQMKVCKELLADTAKRMQALAL